MKESFSGVLANFEEDWMLLGDQVLFAIAGWLQG